MCVFEVDSDPILAECSLEEKGPVQNTGHILSAKINLVSDDEQLAL